MAGEIPKLWSKLESASDVTSPQLGTGGSEIGSPTYEAAKFGNGILSNINSEGCKFPTGANNINLDKGTIEIWTKLNFDPTDPDTHVMWDFSPAANGGIQLLFSENIDDFYVGVRSGGGDAVLMQTVGLAWNSGDLVHFAVTWDRLGNDIGGGKTVALYVNNVLEASSVVGWGADSVLANLIIGLYHDETIFHSDAVIDNLKTYDICKIDFSDKDTEGVPEEGVNTLVQAALISIPPLIALPTLAQILKVTGGC